MPLWAEAGCWGLLAGSALLIGAAAGWWLRISPQVIAGTVAFGAGVLISAMAFELVDRAERSVGLLPTVVGFVAGAVSYVAVNALLARRGAQHRKRSGPGQPSETQVQGSGTAIVVGSLLDGIPESVVLGLSLFEGGIGVAVLAAIFLSNIPEGLSSAVGMREAGRGAGYVFGMWGSVAVLTGVAALAGNLLLETASPVTVAVITAVAAGAILAMIADTMIPEAFARTHLLTGLITTSGFLIAFTLTRVEL